jgi:shikimate dehydrogenase
MAVPYAEVIGDPIGHSKSPLIHRFWLERLGLRRDYRATRVTPKHLRLYLDERRSDPDWVGCNVTMPLKRTILPLLDRCFAEAKAIGAVNTVMKIDRTEIDWPHAGLVGNNTDLRGFAEPFRGPFPERGSAALIGAGGAARAALVALGALGFRITHVANRTRTKAEAMLRELGCHPDLARRLDDPLPAVDLLVNASAIGSRGAHYDLDLSSLPPTAIVYDIVYDPPETALLAAARARGLRTIDGFQMLIGQAAASFVHFFDSEPPRDRDDELRELLTQ